MNSALLSSKKMDYCTPQGLQEPVTNITMEEFAQACFSKGEGWHCLTAAEWGLLADTRRGAGH